MYEYKVLRPGIHNDFLCEPGSKHDPVRVAEKFEKCPSWLEPKFETDPSEGEQSGADGGEPQATDAALALAAEHGVDLSQIQGTGADGKITKTDVEKAIEEVI